MKHIFQAFQSFYLPILQLWVVEWLEGCREWLDSLEGLENDESNYVFENKWEDW